jgi:Flp pilus assembly protein TadG
MNVGSQRGSSIVEAAFLMPFMLCVFIFCIFLSDYIFVKGASMAYTSNYGTDAAVGVQNLQKASITYDANGNAKYANSLPTLNPYSNIIDTISHLGRCESYNPSKVSVNGRPDNVNQVLYNSQTKLKNSIKGASIFGAMVNEKTTGTVSYCPGLFYSSVTVNSGSAMNIFFPVSNLIYDKDVQLSDSNFSLVPISNNAEFARTIDYASDLLQPFMAKLDGKADKINKGSGAIKSLGKALCKIKILTTNCGRS